MDTNIYFDTPSTRLNMTEKAIFKQQALIEVQTGDPLKISLPHPEKSKARRLFFIASLRALSMLGYKLLPVGILLPGTTGQTAGTNHL